MTTFCRVSRSQYYRSGMAMTGVPDSYCNQHNKLNNAANMSSMDSYGFLLDSYTTTNNNNNNNTISVIQAIHEPTSPPPPAITSVPTDETHAVNNHHHHSKHYQKEESAAVFATTTADNTNNKEGTDGEGNINTVRKRVPS